MLAYNQFSGNTALQSAGMGGYGRKGAQRLVILETDGLANVRPPPAPPMPAPYQGYFNVGTGNSYSSSSNRSQYRRHQRGQADLRTLQRFELWPAWLLDHGQAGHDPVHCLRRDLRTDHAGGVQRSGHLVAAVDLDDRRLDVSQFGQRSDQRL